MTFDEWWCKARPFPQEMTDGDLARTAWLAALESREEWTSVNNPPKEGEVVLCIGFNYADPSKGWWEYPNIVMYSNGRFCAENCDTGDWDVHEDLKAILWTPFVAPALPAPPSTPSTEEPNNA